MSAKDKMFRTVHVLARQQYHSVGRSGNDRKRRRHLPPSPCRSAKGPFQTGSDTRPPVQATSDDQLVELWLHSRPASTQRAYRPDVERFREFGGRELRQVTLADLQRFAESLAERSEATRYRCLSAVKSLFAFGHLLGYIPFDVGRVLRLPAVRNRLAERICPKRSCIACFRLSRTSGIGFFSYCSTLRPRGAPSWSGSAGAICRPRARVDKSPFRQRRQDPIHPIARVALDATDPLARGRPRRGSRVSVPQERAGAHRLGNLADCQESRRARRPLGFRLPALASATAMLRTRSIGVRRSILFRPRWGMLPSRPPDVIYMPGPRRAREISRIVGCRRPHIASGYRDGLANFGSLRRADCESYVVVCQTPAVHCCGTLTRRADGVALSYESGP